MSAAVQQITRNVLSRFLEHTLRNKQNGQSLIVANNGAPNAPVKVYGDNGGWGGFEDTAQKRWTFQPA